MHAEKLLSRVFSTVIFLSPRFLTYILEIIRYILSASGLESGYRLFYRVMLQYSAGRPSLAADFVQKRVLFPHFPSFKGFQF